MNKNEIETKEVLVDSRGYLKVPGMFRLEFGTPKKYPNPKAVFVKKDGKIQLIYEWDVEELKRGE